MYCIVGFRFVRPWNTSPVIILDMQTCTKWKACYLCVMLRFWKKFHYLYLNGKMFCNYILKLYYFRVMWSRLSFLDQIPWKISFLLKWPPYPLLEASVVRVIDVFHGVMDLPFFRFSWFNHHFRRPFKCLEKGTFVSRIWLDGFQWKKRCNWIGRMNKFAFSTLLEPWDVRVIHWFPYGSP